MLWLSKPLILIVLSSLLSGCAKWNVVSSERPLLPLSKMAPDAVVLETTQIQVANEPSRVISDLWDEVDEQKIPLAARRPLSKAGFRVGVVGSSLPPQLQQLIDASARAVPITAESVMPTNSYYKRLQVRESESKTIFLSNDDQSENPFLHTDHNLVGSPSDLSEKRLFSVSAKSLGDGHVKLALLPEVESGEPITRFVGEHQQGTWRWQTDRRRTRFEDLSFQVELAPGQSLVLGASGDTAGLGAEFFKSAASEDSSNRILLIRLAHIQQNDLFTNTTPSTTDQHD